MGGFSFPLDHGPSRGRRRDRPPPQQSATPPLAGRLTQSSRCFPEMNKMFAVIFAYSYASAQFNANRPEFEVASVRPSSFYNPGLAAGSGSTNSRYYTRSVPLSFYVR